MPRLPFLVLLSVALLATAAAHAQEILPAPGPVLALPSPAGGQQPNPFAPNPRAP